MQVTLKEQYGSIPQGCQLDVMEEAGDHFKLSYQGKPMYVPKTHITGQDRDRILDAVHDFAISRK